MKMKMKRNGYNKDAVTKEIKQFLLSRIIERKGLTRPPFYVSLVIETESLERVHKCL